MPTILYLFGIYIRIHWREHGIAHFHSYYNEFVAVIAIEDLKILEGSLPSRVLVLVI